MRPAEMISIAFYTIFLIVAVAMPIAWDKRVRALGIGVVGIVTAGLLPLIQPLPGSGVFRDLVPGVLLLIGYWQTGQLMVVGDVRFEQLLRRFDRRWLKAAERLRAGLGQRPGLSRYLEAAYLACYPVMPLAVGVLYLGGRSGAVDQFWLVVLPATFACYAFSTVFQSRPPWMVHASDERLSSSSSLRGLNQWVTDHASIRVNTFPSGHVASSFAIGMVLVEVLPAVGLAFLWIALSIAVFTVVLQYHYGLDVILGIAFAGLSYGLVG